MVTANLFFFCSKRKVKNGSRRQDYEVDTFSDDCIVFSPAYCQESKTPRSFQQAALFTSV
ncbi:hypothetical protein EDS67_00540 [candidate division KSB1 bacterium]|nr:MAG: hypothetical protein EDS67_00540 [candidate division KSB1 bacterium]MBC6946981.1 hypothetical protein [candidate division KSB1 bacterium]MCE7940141.1 hypothetical protein [Chlorobi bacterium CHB1]